MNKIRGLVVAALLAVWCFPAVSSAKTWASEPSSLPAAVTERSAAPAATPQQAAETANLAQREQQARDLQDFNGGAVAIYVSSGVLLVAVIVLLILLI
ncbi:MAG TPA: hypothetical protein VHO06_03925 [Polyangia bacterium]|nr:hypothetical protein [Polyangia bacterium]